MGNMFLHGKARRITIWKQQYFETENVILCLMDTVYECTRPGRGRNQWEKIHIHIYKLYSFYIKKKNAIEN